MLESNIGDGVISGLILIYNELGCYEVSYIVNVVFGLDGVCIVMVIVFILVLEQL